MTSPADAGTASAATIPRVRWPVLPAAILAFALAAPARAEDSPGLALAKSVVEELRGDAHREKMRIVWPEDVEEAPPEGAEVVVITGYISHDMTRFVWRGGKVEARLAFASRTWFYNKNGESFGARELDVDPVAFARAWSAARFVIDARDERVTPRPDPDLPVGGTMGMGSHESKEYVRMRTAGAIGPLHCSDPFGWRTDDEGIAPWEQIRDRSVFRLFEPFLPKKDTARHIDLSRIAPEALDEIRRATSRLDLNYNGEHHVLLEVCLRIAGEAGDVTTREAVENFEKALGAATTRDGSTEASVRRDLLKEAEFARTRRTLSDNWDDVHARNLLRGRSNTTGADWDFDTWIRRRYREQNPVGYLALLAEERSSGAPPAKVGVARTLDEIRTRRSLETTETLRAWISDADPDTRLAAARAILSITPDDREAAAVIVSVATDATIQPDRDRRGRDEGWVRLDALAEASARRLVGPEDLRKLLADPGSRHGLLVQAVLDALARSDEPPTEAETLAAWRSVLDQSVYSALEVAIEKLLDLKDTASREKVAAALERLRKVSVCPPGEIDRLAARLAAEMLEPPAGR